MSSKHSGTLGSIILLTFLALAAISIVIQAEVASSPPAQSHGIVKCGALLPDRPLTVIERNSATAAAIAVRPSIVDELTFLSPSTQFLIHYTVTGEDSVFEASVDTDSNGVPDYIDSVAAILDRVHNVMVDSMGYPPPVSDGFYPSGGDSTYDVYVYHIGSYMYGLAWLDSLSVDGPEGTQATSFLIIDNDYQQLPGYQNRPLDAVRVTVAHEYFHSVQYAIDYTEAPFYNDAGPFFARYWMEISAVWMEERLYDDINDYYSYLPYFFDDARRSLQQYDSFSDLHPFASGIFGIFLDEIFGPDIIREIWLRCGELGGGPHFLTAADHIIDSVSNGTENWATIFRTFALWNWYTGERAPQAPPGVGYSERAQYPAFQADAIDRHIDYPIVRVANENPYNPFHNGAAYIHLDRLEGLVYDTTYWNCTNGSQPDCFDSVEVLNPLDGFDFMHIDSVLEWWVSLGDGTLDGSVPTLPQPWGATLVAESRAKRTAPAIDTYLWPDDSVHYFTVSDPRQYQSITLILTPATPDRSFYDWLYSSPRMPIGYLIPDSADIATDIPGYGEESTLPNDYYVHQNYPNPFNPGTTVSFTLPRIMDYELTVYNVLGQEMRQFTGRSNVGENQIDINAGTWPSGVYFYRLQADDFKATRKMVLLK